MTDTLTPEQRSRNMSAIRSKDTKPEIYFRKKLFALGFRYRKNPSNIYGHPDLFLRRYNTAIFIHGCFWHRHENCKYAYMPKSRTEFWTAKFESNRRRDETVKKVLADQQIRCLVVWECTIKKMQKSSECESEILQKTASFLNSTIPYMEL